MNLDFKNIVLVYIYIMLSVCISAQKQDNIWLFGTSSENGVFNGYQWGNTTIDFSNIEPEVYHNNSVTMDFGGANSSVCDTGGVLQMYTNGMHIYDGEYHAVANGDTIAYSDYWENWVAKEWYEDGSDWITGFPMIQAVLILPIADNVYYALYKRAFSNGEYFVSKEFNYSKIQKNEEDKYEVVSKDIFVKSDIFDVGQVQACRHANGRDWWVIQQNLEADSLFIFLVDEHGIYERSVYISEARFSGSISLSQVSFSPDGSMYAMAATIYEGDEIGDSLIQEIRLFDFDRCAGTLSEIDRDTIETKRLFSMMAFSPSGQYMYSSTYDELYQYDLHEADWVSSRVTIAEYDGFYFEYNEFSGKQETRLGPLALAPDGRIYSVPPGNQRHLHTIEYPDEPGTEAEVIQHKIMIPTSNFRSVPNFPHYRLGPEDGSTCDTLGIDNNAVAQYRYTQDTMDYLNVRFTDLSYYMPESWHWDFGDGSTYDGKKPYYHRFSEDGTYNVCLTVSNENGEDTYCKVLYLGTTSTDTPLISEEWVNLYPNPVEDQVYIEIRDYLPTEGYIYIYNSLGQQILADRIYAGWNHYDVSSLADGMYYYLLYDEGRVYSSQFVKQE